MAGETGEWRGLGERVLTIAAALEAAGIPHAFGGAIAYNFHGQPRATADIDINIFLPESQSALTLEVLKQAGVPIDPESAGAEIARTGQIRLHWQHVPVDLFFSTVPLHDASRDRARWVPFRGRAIPVLSAERGVRLSPISTTRSAARRAASRRPSFVHGARHDARRRAGPR
jgi:hypothetical protein